MAKADRFEGLDADKVTDNTKLTAMSASFAEAKHLDLDVYPAERAMLYKLQKMNDEIKELHRFLGAEVTSNVSTDLSVTTTSTGVKIISSDGTNADISSASTTQAGILTASDFQSISSSSIAPPAEGSYHNGASEHLVWIPGTRFYSDISGGIVYAEGVAKAGTTKSSLYYDFAGIDKKKVTHAYAYTSATVGKGLRIKRWAGILGVSASILANNVSTNVSQDITDWNCVFGESLNIRIFLGSTSTELHGVQLTLAKA